MQAAKAQKFVKSSHCPICALKDRKALGYVRKQLEILSPPFDILLGLKNTDFIPCNVNGEPISTPNRWRDTLKMHMRSCLGMNFDLYEKSWKQQRTDTKLTREFNARAIQIGMMNEEQILANPYSITPAKRQAYIEAMESGDIKRILELPVEDVVNRKDLLESCQHLLPAIIVNQLAIVYKAQNDYLEGRSDTPPTREFATVSRCIELMKTVMGEYGIETAIKIG